jgi:hypothetical protein
VPRGQKRTEVLPLALLGICTAFKEDLQASVAKLASDPFRQHTHTSTATFVHSDFEKCTHVFLLQDTLRRALEPPYSGPYQVLSHREDTLQLFLLVTPVTVSADMVKPATTSWQIYFYLVYTL